jgi:hypothetical protein
MTANGARGRSNNFLIDGTDMNDGYRNDRLLMKLAFSARLLPSCRSMPLRSLPLSRISRPNTAAMRAQ